MSDNRRQLEGLEAIHRFVTGGNAYFTVVNPVKGTRYTFRVSQKENDDGSKSPHFVSVLTGPDNWSNYTYLGCIFADGNYRHGKKSRISLSAKSAVAWQWLYNVLTAGRESALERIEFWHEGRCGRCGRKLTVPESIANGLGPVCEGR